MSITTNSENNPQDLDVESAVRERYSAASNEAEPALCCAVDYDKKYLEVLPQELIERDYGCGDPSKYVREGETVLDLGSGGGKICYIASQIVGESGKVIGVDMNDEMLDLARRFQPDVSEKIGWSNVHFFKGKIQDSALDLDAFEQHIQTRPVANVNDFLALQAEADRMRRETPMIADDSVDVVVSNCVLNLVRPEDRRALFAELFRVLKRGGRAVISDIVADEFVPEHMRSDPTLWSGCISGAFEESEFVKAFEDAGFYGIEIVVRQEEPWVTVEGVEFRSVTIQAYKGKEGACLDHNEAVIYTGPWKSVTDDDGHVLRRGVRSAVCRKTFEIYTSEPYKDSIIAVVPHQEVSEKDAKPYDCRGNSIRTPRETKGKSFNLTVLDNSGGECCGPSDCC